MFGHFLRLPLPGNPGIGRFASRAGQLVAEALEKHAAILTSVIFSKDLFHAAQIYSAATGGAHDDEYGFLIVNKLSQ
jgi:hypothetical protein